MNLITECGFFVSKNNDMTTQLTLFNYETLEPETRIMVQQRTDEIKTLMRRTAQDIIDIGSKLIEVKEKLGHGNFGGWLDAEFGWSTQTAKRFMNVFDSFQNQQIVDFDIAPSALYLLAAPSTPELARTEALQRAESGEAITHKDAKEIVYEYKQQPERLEMSKGFGGGGPEYAPFDLGIKQEWACPECGSINAPFADECSGCREVDEMVRGESMQNVLHSSESNEWYTPSNYIEAANRLMGGIDLDPATCELANKTVKAKSIFTKDDDGLSKGWWGTVFLNPPYGKTNGKSNQGAWAEKLISEYESGNVDEAILLVNAAPSNKWFAPLWDYPICFTSRRIQFESSTGQTDGATHSNCFVYLGTDVDKFQECFDEIGVVAIRYGGKYA